jgi:hypothetical protein
MSILFALAGCASGRIPSRLAVPGQPSEPVVLAYRSGLFGSWGKLSTALPGGERFAGQYVLAPRDPQHQMTGTLLGDRGSTMVCRFILKEPGVGPDGGGRVRCELSTGGTIEGQF